MTFQINGVDITPYIAPKGIAWTRADVDGPNAGRRLDGILVRDRVAIKYRVDVTCRPLKLSEAGIVLGLLEDEWVFVTATNPFEGGVKTYTMYSNNIPVALAISDQDGNDYWDGIAFPLIEQ